MPHPPHPIEQERLPQADLATYREDCAMSGWHGHLLSRALPELHKGWCEPKKLLASCSQGRASFVPDKKRTSKLLFKQAYPGADGCLADMQSLGSLDEASRRDDLQKRPSQFDVHDPSIMKNALNRQLNSFACCIPG